MAMFGVGHIEGCSRCNSAAGDI